MSRLNLIEQMLLPCDRQGRLTIKRLFNYQTLSCDKQDRLIITSIF